MTTVTIPKEAKSGEKLVAVPRSAYKEFLSWQKKVKSKKIFTPTKADKEALARGRKNLSKGNYVSADDL